MRSSIVAVILGLMSGGAIVAVVETAGMIAVPLPPGIDPMSGNIPAKNIMVVLFAWGAGALVGGMVAAMFKPAAPSKHALIVGGILMLAGLTNLIAIPSPLWFWISGLAIFLPSAYLGSLLAKAGKKTSA